MANFACPVCGKCNLESWISFDGTRREASVSHLDCVWDGKVRYEELEAERDELKRLLRLVWVEHFGLLTFDCWLADLRRQMGRASDGQ